MMDLGLKDAAAAVVGGARGMGLATARCLAADGAEWPSSPDPGRP
ncbi:hypothetical protein I552_0873 [Mycobacterium xenopi 3993]|nr:hypothetical protein I552_0873 [Mycobacterium xenopi 3993]